MANGLDDVVAAETVLSDVDGLGGRLTIRGHSLPELAGRWTYSPGGSSVARWLLRRPSR